MLQSFRGVVVLGAMVLTNLGALAQSWSILAASSTPSARNRGALAYDAARGQAVLFGGYDGTAAPLGDSWAFDGSAWQQLGGIAPPARWGHGMIHDTRRARLVLFGGFQPSPGNPIPDAVGLNDTWEHDGFAWTQVATASAPSPRGYFGMVYDPIRQRTVLFGGAGPNTTYLQDTWEWNGASWGQVNTPVRPSVRRGPAMVFDLERAEVVMFGGGALGTQFADTWVFDGASWAQRNPAASPPARWEASMVFDPLCGRALLEGGTTFNYQTIYGDSWNWDGATWTQVSGAQPSARHGAAAAFDLRTGRTLLLGGRDNAGFRRDLWAWSGGCDRSMTTLSGAVAGQAVQYRYNYPQTAVNNLYLELWTLRNPNAFALPIPGIVSVGLTRVDVFFVLFLNGGVLNGSGRQDTATYSIPYSPALVGFSFDVQDLDIDVAGSYLYWSGNDIEDTVAPGLPTAAFAATPTSGPVPLTVQFTDSSVFATSWQWDFQDDGVVDSAQQNPVWHYTDGGSHNVRLTVGGAAGSNSVVVPGAVVTTQSPQILANTTLGPAPLTVSFTGSAFPATSWQWDFENDGIVDSTAQNPQHTYVGNGTYSVRLVVSTPTGPVSVVESNMINAWGGALNPALSMVAIQPGTFDMGADYYGWNNQNEAPVHRVSVTRSFWVGRYEVTQSQYQSLMGSNPSFSVGGIGPSLPVQALGWAQAVSYCDALTAQEAAAGRLPPGYEYRLPTEAEWEYCAKPNTVVWDCAYVNASVPWLSSTPSPCVGRNQPVGSYPPNLSGLFDMQGNVEEYCLDRPDANSATYHIGNLRDPYIVGGQMLVLRGGHYESIDIACRPEARNIGFLVPNWRRGFRVVCAPALP